MNDSLTESTSLAHIYLNGYSKYNGIGVVVNNQIENLANHYDTVEVYCYSTDIDPPESVDVHLMWEPSNNILRQVYRIGLPLFLIPFLLQIYRSWDADLIISHKYPHNLVAGVCSLLSRAKFIYYDHGVADPVVYERPVEKIHASTMAFLQSRSALLADEVFAISSFVAGQLVERGGSDVDRIIYNQLPKWVRQDYGSLSSREEYSINSDDIVFLFVGRIAKHKNIHTLISAFKKTESPGSSEKWLILAGKQVRQGYADELKDIATDRIIFTGYIGERELLSLYSLADVYVTASLWEGYNLPIAEAQYFDLPVVAFDLAAHPEVVNVPPGILVKPVTVNALSEAIETKINEY